MSLGYLSRQKQRSGSEFTPLHMTSHYGHYAVAKLLLEAGASLDSCMDIEETPLIRSAKMGHDRLTKLFNDAGETLIAKNRRQI